MTRLGPFLFLVGLLFIAGITIATFRHSEYRIPLLPGAAQSVWQVEARIEFTATGGSTLASLALPPEQNGYRVIGESGASSRLRLQRRARRTARGALDETLCQR